MHTYYVLSDAVLRGHKAGLITLDFHEFVDDGSKPKFTDQVNIVDVCS